MAHSKHSKCANGDSAAAGKPAPSVPSKDLPPLPNNFTSTFIRNQFRTTIPLPTKEMYPDAAGQRAIVTGSNTGLGFSAAQQLLGLGVSHLIMGVRSLEKGKAAAKQLQLANPKANIDVWQVDMESYPSIRAFAQQVRDRVPGRIDSVILNAGVSRMNRETAASGHESTLQVNHYGTALLALLLLPILKEKAALSATHADKPPHLAIVNSVMAQLCKFESQNLPELLPPLDDEKQLPFDVQNRYGLSKLVNQLFLIALAERVAPVGGNPIISMVDPGLTKGTGLFREGSGLLLLVMKPFMSAAGRPVERGAATFVHAVEGYGAESHGSFLMNAKIAPLAKFYYEDKELPERVWAETLKDPAFSDAESIVRSVQA